MAVLVRLLTGAIAVFKDANPIILESHFVLVAVRPRRIHPR